MSVSSISRTSSILQTSAVSSTASVNDVAQIDGPEPAGVSQMADRMKQLEELSKSDPEKFKKVMTSLADQIQEQADQADQAGDGRASLLSEMAQKFKQAADTGDVSALQPPRPPQGGSPSQRAKGCLRAVHGAAVVRSRPAHPEHSGTVRLLVRSAMRRPGPWGAVVTPPGLPVAHERRQAGSPPLRRSARVRRALLQ
jgi:hypothetical protein